MKRKLSQGMIGKMMKLKAKAKIAKEKVAATRVDCPYLRDTTNANSNTCLLCGKSLGAHNTESVNSRSPMIQSVDDNTFMVQTIKPPTAPSVGGTTFRVHGQGFVKLGKNLAFARFGSSVLVPLRLVSESIMEGKTPPRQSYLPVVLVSFTIDGGLTWSSKNLQFKFQGERSMVSGASAVVHWGDAKPANAGKTESWTRTCFYGSEPQKDKKTGKKKMLTGARPDIYTLSQMNVWETAPSTALAVHHIAASEHGTIVLSANGTVFTPPTTLPTTDDNLMDTAPFAPGMGVMTDVPAEDAKAGNDAIRANRARQLKNFNYVVRRTAWLFCSPLSEHLRLDAKREKKLKPTAVKSRKMLVERVPHWQMLISVRYRKIERVAAGHGHFCMVSGVMDKFKLYTFGLNNFGQCGLGDAAPRKRPTEVPIFNADHFGPCGSVRRVVTSLSCGPNYTVCAALNVPSGTTSVYAWGSRNSPPEGEEGIEGKCASMFNQGRPYPLLFTAPGLEHLESRANVKSPAEVLSINYWKNFNSLRQTDFLAELIDDQEKVEELGTEVFDLPCAFTTPFLRTWLEGEYKNWIDNMNVSIGTDWCELTKNGEYSFTAPWLSKDKSGLTKALYKMPREKMQHVEHMTLLTQALDAVEHHVKMYEGLCNDVCSLSGVDSPFPQDSDETSASIVLATEIACLLKELEMDMANRRIKIEAQRETIRKLATQMHQMNVHKEELQERARSLVAKAATKPGAPVSPGDTKANASTPNSSRSLTRNTVMMNMKPVSTSSLRRTHHLLNVSSDTENALYPWGNHYNEGEDYTGKLYSIFEPKCDGNKLRAVKSSVEGAVVLGTTFELKREKMYVSNYVTQLKKDISYARKDIVAMTEELSGLEEEHQSLLSSLAEIETVDGKASTDNNGVMSTSPRSEVVDEVSVLESTWAMINRYSPNSLSMLHSQMHGNVKSVSQNSVTKAAGGSVVRNQVRYEDLVQEASHLQDCQTMGVYESTSLSNILLKSAYESFVFSKLDICRHEMKTELAYPCISYLVMLSACISLRGKYNFATMAYTQLLATELCAPSSEKKVHFFDDYDMTRNQWMSMEGEVDESKLHISKTSGVSERSSTYLEMEHDPHRSDPIHISRLHLQQAEKAMRRAPARSSEELQKREFELIIEHCALAVEIINKERTSASLNDLMTLDYDYLQVLSLQATALAHLGRLEEASVALDSAFNVINTEISHVDKSVAKVAKKAFKKQSKELHKTLNVPHPRYVLSRIESNVRTKEDAHVNKKAEED